MFDSVHRPTFTQNTVAVENGTQGGHTGEVVPSRAFSFLVSSTRAQQSLYANMIVPQNLSNVEVSSCLTQKLSVRAK